MLAFLQKIGKSLMLPVATLPAAAILLRFGSIDYIKDFHLGDGGWGIPQHVYRSVPGSRWGNDLR
ncbi:hypothetical protein HMSSN139_50520 [Paenibacillus sp. HMSSN-139]|nr:hypothetical protein HMSSN139_50520 [Paenibacillus sp. HMSSN-139]